MNLFPLLTVFEDLTAYRQLRDSWQVGEQIAPLQLPDAAKAPILSKLFASCDNTILLITGRVEAVPVWQQALEAWLPDEVQIDRFPEPTPLPYERGPWSRLSRSGRLTSLASLQTNHQPRKTASSPPLLIITSARALLQKTIPLRKMVASTRRLRIGQIIDLKKLVSDWQAAGYTQSSVVETEGQFSRRGGILDIYPIGAINPTRIELFGDEIDSLRAFDPATQRSLNSKLSSVESVVIPPAREVLPVDAMKLGKVFDEYVFDRRNDLPSWKDDVKDLMAGTPNPNLEFYLPMIYSQPGSIIDYLPESAGIVIDDFLELETVTHDLQKHAQQIADEQPELPPDFPNPLFGWSETLSKLALKKSLVLGEGEAINTPVASCYELGQSFQPGPSFGGQIRPFLMQLRKSATSDQTTIIVSRQSQRLAELWWEDSGKLSTSLDSGNGLVQPDAKSFAERDITFIQGSLTGGFILENHNGDVDIGERSVLLNLLTDSEIFGWNRPTPRRRRKPRPVAPETFYADITPGDFVVHSEFGIGQFKGLVVRTIAGSEREYLQVRFSNSDILYVPVHNADRLSKWIGPDDRTPKLQRLGEISWGNAKRKAQKAIDELADELLELYAVRETISGHAFASDTPWQAELEASFPHRETEDQHQAILDVKNDMERPYPMDRLICGDVGYGKTEVALRASFKAVMDSKQVALLVPTTVLAQQHYNTFKQRLQPFPVNLEMLSRFRTSTQQSTIIRGLRAGQIDIVIGTHRMLSDDVSFKDLGLLIIDEEQRFGVAHKEKLKQLRKEVDVLTMTATPIPRTLYLSLSGARDISQIDTAPIDRLPIQTYVGEYDESFIRRAILRELDRGGQAFYVHNRVQTIQTALIKLSNLVPEATIAVGHGQMSERELEDVMLRYVNGEIDVLLTTTIIESGLDIPNSNTIIVDRADRFGLAQLYQLRGRVGRGVRRAFAYFLHPPWHKMTSDAKVRLEVLGEQTELGAGYSIAMRDLEIRGSGDLLGSRQSGHIAAVGFSLYTRMLAKAVRKRRAAIRGEETEVELPDMVMVDLPLAAYIPTDYVPDSSLRLRLYRRMAVLGSMAGIDEMAIELADRFGAIPDPVDNLLYQLRVKVMARQAFVSSVNSEANQIVIKLADRQSQGNYQLQATLGEQVRVSRRGIWLGREMKTREWQILLVQTLEKLQELRND